MTAASRDDINSAGQNLKNKIMKFIKTYDELNEGSSYMRHEGERFMRQMPKDLKPIFTKYPKLTSVTYNPYSSDGSDGYISTFYIEYDGDKITCLEDADEYNADNADNADVVAEIYSEFVQLEDKYPGPEAAIFGDEDPDMSLKANRDGSIEFVKTER